MSSNTNNTELSSKAQLRGNTNTGDEDTLSVSKELSTSHEIVRQLESLESAPVLIPTSTYLRSGAANEYLRLFSGIGNIFTILDYGLPAILKKFGNPLAGWVRHCYCGHVEAHTCWVRSEFCGAKGKQSDRRRKLVNALHEAVDAFEKGLLCMCRNYTVLESDPQPSARLPAGRITPGLYELATRRLASLTHGVEQLQEFHKPSHDTSPDKLNPLYILCEGGTYNNGSEDNSGDSNKDLVDLKQRLSACWSDLLKLLEKASNMNESIIKASEDLKLAVRTYDKTRIGPRSVVREYYRECVLQVADAMPKLDHYHEHPSRGELAYHLEEIDNGYEISRGSLVDCRYFNRAETDGLGRILWLIWDETRSYFERRISSTRVERPAGLGWEYNAERWGT